MRTRHKIQAARVLYRAVGSARKIVGAGDSIVARRAGITYDLDLSQGVDFGIYLGIYERETVAVLRSLLKPGSFALDIGANVGAIALAMAQLVGQHGQVLAIEPTQYAYDKLVRNVALNPELAARTSTLRAFLGENDGAPAPAGVFASWPLSGSTDLHPVHRGRAEETGEVATRRLDSVLAGRTVDFIKLDVDGYETAVLAGASNLLKSRTATFLIELAPYVHAERGYSFERFLDFFEGYRLTDLRRRPLPQSAEGLRNLIGRGASINALALPPGGSGHAGAGGQARGAT